MRESIEGNLALRSEFPGFGHVADLLERVAAVVVIEAGPIVAAELQTEPCHRAPATLLIPVVPPSCFDIVLPESQRGASNAHLVQAQLCARVVSAQVP